jgi:hypothetical protein
MSTPRQSAGRTAARRPAFLLPVIQVVREPEAADEPADHTDCSANRKDGGRYRRRLAPVEHHRTNWKVRYALCGLFPTKSYDKRLADEPQGNLGPRERRYAG